MAIVQWRWIKNKSRKKQLHLQLQWWHYRDWERKNLELRGFVLVSSCGCGTSLWWTLPARKKVAFFLEIKIFLTLVLMIMILTMTMIVVITKLYVMIYVTMAMICRKNPKPLHWSHWPNSQWQFHLDKDQGQMRCLTPLVAPEIICLYFSVFFSILSIFQYF